MSALDWLVLLLIGAGVFLAARQIRRGNGRCGAGCGGCARAGACRAAAASRARERARQLTKRCK